MAALACLGSSILVFVLCVNTRTCAMKFLGRNGDSLLNRSSYFAYGADMLLTEMKRLMQDSTGTPVFVGPAALKGFRLDFEKSQRSLDGATSTICKAPHNSVWGVVWSLKMDDFRKLKLKGNSMGLSVLYLPVYSPMGVEMLVMTFSSRNSPKILPPWTPLPLNRRPSLTYLMSMVNGAIEARLPGKYIAALNRIPHNDNMGREARLKSRLPYPRGLQLLDPSNFALSVQINNKS